MVDDYKNQAIRIYILNPLLRLKKYDNDFGIISPFIVNHTIY